MLKKKQAKKLIFAPKIALRVECSDPARNHQLCADFLNVRLQCSQLLPNCGNIKPLYRRGRGERQLETAQTIGPSSGITHCPEPVFVNVYGAQESIPRNRFCQYDKQGYVPARQAGNRFLGSLKGLQIRALAKQNIIVATSLCLFARKYTKKNSVKMVFTLYRVLCRTAH